MKILGRYESSVSSARVGTKSLRTTIPEGIANPLELKRGDKLTWEVVLSEKGEIYAAVKKKEMNITK
jgi:bifunctional DNA-binding transcriptional regulator/antitoxin component of YhaV-PrlF toxin-antitoxin module